MLSVLGSDTQWSESLSEASLSYQQSLVENVENAALRWVASRTVIHCCQDSSTWSGGTPLALRILASTGYTDRKIRAWSAIARILAVATVKANHLWLRLPGRRRRMERAASGGDRFQNTLHSVIADLSEKHALKRSTFDSHDASSARDFEPPQ